ncbi:MAG: Fe-S cluster assembly protein SufD [Cyanobacteriota bacterium]|nr:Fe-S cluster assembly protein SufD [Cyanobacteriota bacterium]
MTASLSPRQQNLESRRFLQDLLAVYQLAEQDVCSTPFNTSLTRQKALRRLSELAIPSLRDEDWQYSDLSALWSHRFQPITHRCQSSDLPSEKMASFLASPLTSVWLVVVNGLSRADNGYLDNLPPGISLHFGSDLDSDHSDSLLQKSFAQPDFFTTLNTACCQDFVQITVADHVEVAQPLHLLWLTDPTLGRSPGVSTETAVITQPRLMVRMGKGSRLTLVEDYVSEASVTSFCNSVSELVLAESAVLNHTYLQRQSLSTFHLGKTAVSQAKGSQYQGQAISLGSQFSRHTLEIEQTAEQAQSLISGLTLMQGRQVGDTFSQIDHQAAYGSSQHLHKTIVTDQAHAIFRGHIRVRPLAQLTEAAQSNRNLLHSTQGRVDTKPQLEILADNVKCAHGATVSQLDEDELFYLQSRGIDPATAHRWLTYAFAAEVLERIPMNSLRQELRQLLLANTQADPEGDSAK